MSRSLGILLGLTLLLMSSCQTSDSQLYTAKVYRGDFYHRLQVEGQVQPNASVLVPVRDDNAWTVIQWVVDDGTYVHEGDVVCVLDSSEFLQYREQILLTIESGKLSYQAGVARLNSQYAELEAKAKSNELQARLSRLDSLQLAYYSPTQRKIAELNLRKNAIEQAKLDRQLATTKVVNEAELKRLEMELRQYEELEQRYSQVLKGAVVRAPADGMILLATSRDDESRKILPGEYVARMVGRIVTDDGRYVQVQVSEQDVKRIDKGQEVSYRFPGQPQWTASGKILSKTPVGRQLVKGSSLQVFDVTASIDSCTEVPMPEMTAQCQVCLRHIPDTLMLPLVAVFEEDSARVVYVKQEHNKYRRQQVSVAAQSPFEVVLSQGLQEGDEVALIKPADNHIINLH